MDFDLVIVHDELTPCPYLDGIDARMPLEYPRGGISPAAFDRLLESGYRRSGIFVYYPQCPNCNECVPTRVDVQNFSLSKSMRRVIKRGDREFQTCWNVPTADRKRAELYNRHRNQRDLATDDSDVSVETYHSFLASSCTETLELSLVMAGRLVGISIMDVGESSVSAVYTLFDESAAKYSPGTFAVLKQIEWAAENQRRHVYLGLYVRDNVHLNYKARFKPQQRLQGGTWQDIT